MNSTYLGWDGTDYGVTGVYHADGTAYANIDDDGKDSTVPAAMFECGAAVLNSTSGAVFKADTSPPQAGILAFDGSDLYLSV